MTSPLPHIDESRPRVSVAALWGVTGVVLMLVSGVARVLPWAVEPWLDGSLQWWHAGLYAGSIAFNAWAEGYRGFQRGVAPRVAARAEYLSRNPTLVNTILAPLFVGGFYGATRRRLISRYILLLGIVALVVLIRSAPQPWRGIVDAGVVVGLGWGAVAVVMAWLRVLNGHPPEAHHDVPGAPMHPALRRSDAAARTRS